MAIPLRPHRTRDNKYRSSHPIRGGCKPLPHQQRTQDVSQRLLTRSIIIAFLSPRPALPRIGRHAEAKRQATPGHHRRGPQRHNRRQASTKHNGSAKISREESRAGRAVGQSDHGIGSGGRALEEHRHQQGTCRVSSLTYRRGKERNGVNVRHTTQNKARD